MMLASIAWGLWWAFFFALRLNQDSIVALAPVKWISFGFAGLGLAVALFSLRAARTWIVFVLFPILANLSIFFVPWLVEDWLAQLR